MIAAQSPSLNMDAKFKKTPIGEIPVEWEVAHIADVCEINPSKQEAGHLSGDDSVSFLPMENVSENGKGIISMQERPIKEVRKGYVYFKEDDILFAKITPCMENGKIAIASKLKNGIGFGSTEFHVLRPNKKKLIVVFAFQWLVRDTFRQFAVQHFRGSAGQQRVQRDFFAQASIPVPPLGEQKKIAEILSSVDDAIEKADAVIAKTRDLKKALMQRLLTRGIGHTKFKKTPIGEIPVDWRVTTFRDSFQFFRTANNSRDDLTPTGQIGYLHYGDIHTKWRTRLVCSRINLPRIDENKVLGVPRLQNGDLVMANASEDYDGVGVAVEISNIGEQEIVPGLHTFLLRDKSTFADGFRGYIQYIPSIRQQLLKVATGVSVFGLSKGSLLGVQIPQPPLDEQKKIADILSSVDEAIEMAVSDRNQLEQTKKSLMADLLTGRVRTV